MTHVLRSEWTKIRSVRSTVWTLAVTALLMLGLGGLVAYAAKSQADSPIPPGEVAGISLNGIMFAAVAMATLGVLVISSEYRTGGIRISLQAVPQRMKLLTAKIVVFTLVALVVSTIASAGAVLVGVLVIQPETFDLGGAAQQVIGAGAYLTVCGLLGLALGALVRHTPGAIVAAMALMLVLPQLTSMLPGEWGVAVHNHFTTNAGLQVVMDSDSNPLGPWSGLGVYLLWAVVPMLAAAVLMKRRDA
ncbi:ABC transporter permease subunit [Nonomuraea sp. NN258]|uniref:ABC transporter permease n=1 Tax=Nonomuraea antri TaxID=2730852 RepID=UPI0015687A9A|nr:ABC transporter permease [Nonomuraea antri]NRQ31403.1 ABC transporter permease subunit [Nonomuraea antri]